MRQTKQARSLMRALIVAGFGISLAGCVSSAQIASIQGGANKVFDPPPHVILGKTSVDQRWINRTIERGIAALGWKRPGPRPAGLDASKASVPAPPKRKRFWQRFIG